jgi:hypothetical protein
MPISAVGLPIRLYGPAVPTTLVAGAVLYTAPSDGRVVIRSVIASNTSTTTTNVSLILGINGVAALNQFLPTLVLTGNAAPTVIVGDIVLNPGDTINGTQGSAGTVTVIISGESYPV